MVFGHFNKKQVVNTCTRMLHIVSHKNIYFLISELYKTPFIICVVKYIDEVDFTPTLKKHTN